MTKNLNRFPPDFEGYSPDVDMVDLFIKEVCDRADQVDPGNEEHWGSLTLGWAIAKGMDPKPDEDRAKENNAHDFARYIRYRTDLA